MGNIYGLVVGAVAVAWGVAIAFLDQPGAAERPTTKRWCTALLTTGAVVAAAGGLAAATGLW